jgi:alpha-N-arabinofuranosidase
VRDGAGAVTVFAVNRDPVAPLRLAVDLRGLGALPVAVEHHALWDGDRHATNTRAEPDRVVPRAVTGAAVTDGRLTAELPPLSWNTLRLR